jgi:hypothetical protein
MYKKEGNTYVFVHHLPKVVSWTHSLLGFQSETVKTGMTIFISSYYFITPKVQKTPQ